jgi:hypothetical protein
MMIDDAFCGGFHLKPAEAQSKKFRGTREMFLVHGSGFQVPTFNSGPSVEC